MRDIMSVIYASNYFAYDALFQWMVGGRGEKMWRIQCWSLVKVQRSRPPVRLNISKRTIPLQERKLSFESQEQILRMKYMIVCALAHNGPQTCLQSQDTAKILVCPKHFSASVHFISTESLEYFVK